MILLIGTEHDKVLSYFAYYASTKNKKVLFFNTKSLGSKNYVGSNYFLIQNKKYLFKDFTGVLNRMSTSLDKTPAHAKHIQFLTHVLSCELGNVLNRMQHSCLNGSKLLQISSIKTKHIKIPTSYVICKKDLRDFLTEFNCRFIFKSLSSIRSIATEFNASDNRNYTPDEPVMLQEFIEGDNIRVHVVKNKLIATLIKSDTLRPDQIDYRYSGNRGFFYEYNLPKEIEDECFDITKQSSLKFSGIDLIRTKDNDFYLLEINPSPGYSHFEEKLQNRDISRALIEALSA